MRGLLGPEVSRLAAVLLILTEKAKELFLGLVSVEVSSKEAGIVEDRRLGFKSAGITFIVCLSE